MLALPPCTLADRPIAPHLPTSPRISPHLPASPHISPVSPPSRCAFLGSLAFDPAVQEEWGTQAAQAFIEGVCGGMMGAMVFNTILPEV